MRKPIIAGNWKMNNGIEETSHFFNSIKEKSIPPGLEVVVCPPFTSLYIADKLSDGSSIKLGAQDVYWEISGAFTGEISPIMLRELGCKFVIIGHSERRGYFGETDEMVNKKILASINNGLIPIICVGENLTQRENGETDSFIKHQVEKALKDLEENSVEKVVIAYEPLWAIGTGKTADAEEANRVIGLIRNTVKQIYSEKTAETVRVLYGGSVKPENIKQFMSQPEIDGVLVGGASLKPEVFWEMIEASKQLL